MERLDALERLSIITDDQSSLDTSDVDTNRTPELLVISSPPAAAAGSLTPNNVVTSRAEAQVASAQSTIPLDSQMCVIF